MSQTVSAPETAPETTIVPRVRTSPFFEATRRWGCNAYTVYNHMWMPLYYESPEADFWRLVDHVALWDVAVERQVEIGGPDAARFTQLLTPRNLSGCAVGQCKYAPITDENGGMINDPVLLRLADDRFWLSLADSDVLLWAKGVAVNAGMDVTVHEPDVSPLQVQGPKSVDVMADLFGDSIHELKYYWFRETELDGIPVVVSRTGWSTERGYEVFLRDSSRGDELWERIMAAGEPYRIGPGAPSHIRRIEAGLVSYGADAWLDVNPFELGLDRLVDVDQEAEFIGKSALTRIKAEGVTRRLVGVEIHGDRLAAPNERHWRTIGGDGQPGTLTSCVYSPRLEKNIGMAIVPVAHAAIGTALTIETPDGEREATVAPLPFHDPKKQIVTAA